MQHCSAENLTYLSNISILPFRVTTFDIFLLFPGREALRQRDKDLIDWTVCCTIMATLILKLLLLSFVGYELVNGYLRTISLGQRWPDKDEIETCGNIRDIIRRNSGRFRKILVRNTNGDIVFQNDDCRRMTARAKSKLDVLASRVRGQWSNVRLKVKLAWTDQVLPNAPISLHYEGWSRRDNN